MLVFLSRPGANVGVSTSVVAIFHVVPFGLTFLLITPLGLIVHALVLIAVALVVLASYGLLGVGGRGLGTLAWGCLVIGAEDTITDGRWDF